MKKLLIVLIMVGMLIGAGGCNSNAQIQKVYTSPDSIGAADAMGGVVIGMVDKVVIGNRSCTIDPFEQLCDRFLQQEQSIAAGYRYTYNNLTSPYQIGTIPTNQYDWMKWHVMNVKLGKYLTR